MLQPFDCRERGETKELRLLTLVEGNSIESMVKEPSECHIGLVAGTRFLGGAGRGAGVTSGSKSGMAFWQDMSHSVCSTVRGASASGRGSRLPRRRAGLRLVPRGDEAPQRIVLFLRE